MFVLHARQLFVLFTNEMRFWSDLHFWLHVVNFCKWRITGVQRCIFVQSEYRKKFKCPLFILPYLFNFQNIEMKKKDILIGSLIVLTLHYTHVHWYDFIHPHIDSCSCTIRFNENLAKFKKNLLMFLLNFEFLKSN